MTGEELRAIRERCDAATPGPWEFAAWNTLPNGYLYGPAPIHAHEPIPPGLYKCTPPVSLRGEDALFVAHARQDVPALLAEVERLKHAVAQEREACAKLAEAVAESSQRLAAWGTPIEGADALEIAAAIRARG